MYVSLGEAALARLGQTVTRNQELTQLDVMSSKIDVFAQRALFRMLRADPESNRVARNLTYAVKLKVLGGIYKEDQKAPALRAQKMGKGWWQLIPKGANAICVKEPVGLPPMIVFRDKIRSTPSQLDQALKRAWTDCGFADLSPPPYRPKAFPQYPKPKPSPPPDDHQRCDETILRREFEKCDGHYNQCTKSGRDLFFNSMLQCGSDRECRNRAHRAVNQYRSLCISSLAKCQERARYASNC